MLPTKFRFIWPNGFRGKESKKSANQKQETPVVAMFITDRDRMSNLYRGPSIDASYQASDHLARRFQRKRFLEIDQSETRIACGGCL
jgi:predicted aminopeptidase